MNIQWWRSWHGAPTDHKWAVIAARSKVKVGIVSAVAWALMDYASQNKDRGSVAGFDTETYSVYSGFDEEEIKAVINAMVDKGVIVNGMFTNWEKRQPKREDDSSERVARHREMKRSVTQCNENKDDETFSSSSLIFNLNLKENDKFDQVQDWIEKTTGLPPSGKSAINAINELVKSDVIEDDIKTGYQWLNDNGKTLKYYSSLVGPAKTAMAKRLQINNYKPSNKDPYEGAKRYD
jgi:major membrane immunogen (membrane-anchored lipoprotein)